MDFARMCASPEMSALLNHTLEFYFECDDGRVCGAGAQPPLHMFGTPMTLDAVLVMGKVQPLQLLDKVLARDLPTPEWAYPSWNPRVGTLFKIGFISSDLLRNHPVGNMMRHVLPLHDLSRMEVTLFIIHEQQRYQIQLVENHHILGEVHIKMIGRGPPVTQFWDETASIEAADVVNSAGICVLFDLIGYTSDHRQDVLALRPAPIQVCVLCVCARVVSVCSVCERARACSYPCASYLARPILSPHSVAHLFCRELCFAQSQPCMPVCFNSKRRPLAARTLAWRCGYCWQCLRVVHACRRVAAAIWWREVLRKMLWSAEDLRGAGRDQVHYHGYMGTTGAPWIEVRRPVTRQCAFLRENHGHTGFLIALFTFLSALHTMV